MIAISPNHGFDLDDFKAFLITVSSRDPELASKDTALAAGRTSGALKLQSEMKGMVALINSMTLPERCNHRLIDASRSARIVRGAGADKWLLKKTLRLYEIMAQVVNRQ